MANTIKDILPFGSGDNVEFPLPGKNDNGGITSGGNPESNLYRISDAPVAGITSFMRNNALVVRYTDRATGHIYDINPLTLEKIKITNNTLPKIYEAHFRSDGSKVIYRFLRDDSDTVENLSLTLVPPKATSTDNIHSVNATPLRGDILELATGVDNNIFYTLRDSSSIATSNFEGGNLKTLYTSLFKDWLLKKAGSNLLVTTKASSGVSGFSYMINATSGGAQKLLGPLPSLTVTPNKTGNRIAYSYYSGSLRLQAKTLPNGEASEIFPGTFSEKCTWGEKTTSALYCAISSHSSLPEIEEWYQGIAHLSDVIWRFDVDNGFADELVDPKREFGIDLDVVQPTLSPNEDYLFFINKTDLSLWALKLD